MILKRIFLHNFRNYKDVDVELSDGANVLIGRNAQGKTNFLESIYFLATGKPYRPFAEDRDLIRWDAKELFVRGEIIRFGRGMRIEIGMTRNEDSKTSKRIRVGGKEVRKISEFFGTLAVVFLSPEDIGIVQGPPSERRRWIDVWISQVNPMYLRMLQTFFRLLKQRNNLLKAISSGIESPEVLRPWDEQMAQVGAWITRKRAEMLELLNPILSEVYTMLSGGEERIGIDYRMSGGTSEEEFLDKLHGSRDSEISYGVSLIGPHRDEIVFTSNGMSLRDFGSTGQQRCAVIALKFAEGIAMEREIGERPVLLLDDILLELDEGRRGFAKELISGRGQWILTSSREEDVRDLDAERVLRVEGGVIREDGGSGEDRTYIGSPPSEEGDEEEDFGGEGFPPLGGDSWMAS
jgi:DNA replication and repair protein RecF